MVAGGQGVGAGDGKYVFYGESLVGKDEKLLQVGGGKGCCMPLSHMLKMVKKHLFVMYILR